MRERDILFIKIALVEICVLVILALTYSYVTRTTGREIHISDDEYTFTLEPGLMAESIQNNYLAYLRKSYILIGTYPDCEFIKITDKYARNDYDVEEFYIDDDSDYMYYHTNGQRTSRLAIDVSSFQSDINWTEVKNSGIDVAIVRIGYRGYESGVIMLDDMYNAHMTGAEAAGMELGVYFFTQATSYEEGVEEAQFVLANLGNYNITQPIVIDTELIETGEARANGIDSTARTDAILGFCDTIRNAGYTPMIYANRNWYALNIDMSRLGDYALWLAYYSNQPDFPYMYYGWQYTNEAIVPGMENPADLNVWFR